jgi:hypothetical protein
VLLNNEHLSIIKQAGELAKEHNANIHLLLMPEITRNRNRSSLFRLLPFWSPGDISEEEALLLASWKRYLQINCGLVVTCVLKRGNWKKGVIKYAKNIRADVIILKEQSLHQKFPKIGRSPVEFIIEHSRCQVITIFSKSESLTGWRQIVIPVTNCVPEMRIKMILKMAKAFNFKIHLIAISGDEAPQTTPSFYFLTETLKLLKNAGNIQVECTYLKSNINPVSNFLKYTKTHYGDALLTNETKYDADVVYLNEYELKKNIVARFFYPGI